jgi:hypothetical protein
MKRGRRLTVAVAAEEAVAGMIIPDMHASLANLAGK